MLCIDLHICNNKKTAKHTG